MTDTQHEPPEELEPEIEEVVVEKPARDFDKDAREMGWRPKDEWHGDPDGFRDAEEFVKRGEEIVGYMRRDRDTQRAKAEKAEADRDDRVRRLEGKYIDAMKRQVSQHEAEVTAIKAGERKAVEEGDVAAFDELTKRRDALGDAPEVPSEAPQHSPADDAVKEWAKSNPWFYSDPAMRGLATATAGNAAQSGADVHAQLAAAEAEVKKRFPEKFETPRAIVETGGGVPKRAAPKSKGVAALPKEAREAFTKFVGMGVYKESELADYAKSYWEQE